MANSFSTQIFSYDQTRRELFAEASTLGPDFTPGLDVQMTSHRTGQVKTFTYTGSSMDREGEVLTWEYNAACGLRLAVAND